MPDINVGSQIFDICFHPTESLVFVGLLTGGVKAFSYDEQGRADAKFSVRLSKRSCRGLATSEDGSRLYAVGKAKTIFTLDSTTGKQSEIRANVHQSPVNRIKRLNSWMLSTGDDDGVVKLWDPRKKEEVRSYSHHFDFISDFMWVENKRQLVCTSGDGTLSVIDIRSSKSAPLVQSEDQEDELLSIVPIRGGEKTVVGTQQGILSIFNRASGWGDCVDRIPGHPHSIDALATVPSQYPNATSTILTGSSDGLVRAVQLFPTKLLGVVSDHGDFPIERIAVDREGEGQWVGSVGHDECVKLTDLRKVFEDEDGSEGDADEAQSDEAAARDGNDNSSEDEDLESGSGSSSDSAESDAAEKLAASTKATSTTQSKQKTKTKTAEIKDDSDNDEDEEDEGAHVESDVDSSGTDSDDSDEGRKRKKKKRKVQDPLGREQKRPRRARNDEVRAEDGFFADL